ncbi:cortactin, partial [Schistosoma bovis]
VDWNHIEVTEKHTSQKDYAKGFGGKYGVERDRQDKSSVGWDHKEAVEKHSSQKDYSVGFGGKFGVQTDRQDKSALGWDHHEQSSHHPSQVDYSKGFGGKFGLQTDRVDSSSVGWNDVNQTESHPSQMKAPIFKPDGSLSNIRARFEQGINPNNVKDSSGLTVAQQRVLEEQTRWNAERKQQQQQREQQEDEEQSRGKSGSSDTVKSVTNNSVFTDTIKPTNNNTIHDHNWNKQVDSENNMKSLHSQEFTTFVHDNPVASDDQVPEMFTVTAMYDYEAEDTHQFHLINPLIFLSLPFHDDLSNSELWFIDLWNNQIVKMIKNFIDQWSNHHQKSIKQPVNCIDPTNWILSTWPWHTTNWLECFHKHKHNNTDMISPPCLIHLIE